MALYHFSARIYTRAKGQSACGAAAYRSGQRIECQYNGTTYDYRNKRNIENAIVLLPANAPVEYSDRAVLWNSVENNEQANGRLCREIELALPKELPNDVRQKMAIEFINENMVMDGMCADIAFHNPPKMNSHKQPLNIKGEITQNPNEYIYDNPHVHCLLTLRAIDENGKWTSKKMKLYVCERDGIQKSLSASQLKNEPGWEKLYYYSDINGKKVWKTKTYASEHPEEGLVQLNRYPKCENIENPKVKKWDDSNTLLEWREAWANKINEYYELYGIEEEVSHLSYEARELDLIPTVHEGKTVTICEKRLDEMYQMQLSIGLDATDYHTDIRQLNIEIKEYNEKIVLENDLKKLQIKMQELIQPVIDRVNRVQLKIAHQLEQLRHDIISLGIKIKEAVLVKSDTDAKIAGDIKYKQELEGNGNKITEELEQKIKSLQNNKATLNEKEKNEIDNQIKILNQRVKINQVNQDLSIKINDRLKVLQEQTDRLDKNIEEMKAMRAQKINDYNKLEESINVDDGTIIYDRMRIRAEFDKNETQEYKIAANRFDGINDTEYSIKMK